MAAEVADELKVLAEAALVEHAIGVAAHRESASCFEVVMLVEAEAVGILAEGAAIDHGLEIGRAHV